MKMDLQIISSVDGSSENLAQIQEIVIPIIVFTFENRLLGQLILCFCWLETQVTIACRSL